MKRLEKVVQVTSLVLVSTSGIHPSVDVLAFAIVGWMLNIIALPSVPNPSIPMNGF